MEVVLEAAESFSIVAIKRCSLLNDAQKEVILDRATTPTSLKHLTRLTIRRLLGGYGPYVLEKIADLPIPDLIQQYLLYEVR